MSLRPWATFPADLDELVAKPRAADLGSEDDQFDISAFVDCGPHNDVVGAGNRADKDQFFGEIDLGQILVGSPRSPELPPRLGIGDETGFWSQFAKR